MKQSVKATLTKDYKSYKKGETLSFSKPHYDRLKKEGYFDKVKKITKEKESES